MDILKEFQNLKDVGKEKIDNYFREKAIIATKARLAENHLTIEEFSDEELEVIIQEEERKIKDDFKTKFLSSTLAVVIGVDLL
jgi:hypothetical protein